MVNSQKKSEKSSLLHWGRAIIAIFALLIAAAHLPFSGGSGPTVHTTSTQAANQIPAPIPGPSFNPMSFWFDVEVIAYTLMAVVYILGLRTWYIPAVLFNAFNLAIYFISGVTAIPGVTSMAFGGRFMVFSSLSTTSIIAFSWICVLILGLILLKFDPGSELDELLATRKS